MNTSEHIPARYDLHLHTFWSYDATARIEHHFKRARELGVRCIAITKHHVLDSLADVLECAKDYPEVKSIPSAELSVTTSIGAVDLLCYGFPLEFTGELHGLLENYHAWQQAAGAARFKALQALGHKFSDADRMELLETYRPPQAIAVQGNTHLKNNLLHKYCVENGLFSVGGSDSHTDEDIQEFFAGHRDADEWLDEFLDCLTR